MGNVCKKLVENITKMRKMYNCCFKIAGEFLKDL
jgi:hypothetical protein